MKIKTTKITAVISAFIALAVLCSALFTAPQIKALDDVTNGGASVTYHGNGGITENYSDSCVLEGENAAENMFYKASSVFLAWNTRPDGLGDTYAPGSEIPADGAVLDLYASWDDGMFTITYDGNGGVTADGNATVSGGQAKNGDVVVCGENPGFSKEGHSFVAWNTKADGSGQRIDVGRKFQMVGRNFTLYAMWEETAESSDSEPAQDTENTENDTSVDTSTENAEDTEKESDSDDGKYDIIYAGNGGKTAEGKETYLSGRAAEGEIVTFEKSGLFTYEGHIFVSWNTKADGSGQRLAPGKKFQMIGRDFTIYAIWEEVAASDSEKATDTSTATDKDTTTDSEKRDTDTTKKGEYQLTYVIDSDNMIVGGHYDKDEVVTTGPFTGKAPEGKKFSHWSTTADDTGIKFPVGQTFNMPGGHVLLYAIFVDENEAPTGNTVTYNSNYGDTDDATVVDGPFDFREVVVAKANTFKKDGYTFVCWNTAADGSGTDVLVNDKFYMPSSSVVLYARWAVNGSAEAEAANSGKYTSTSGSTYSGAVKTGVDNTVVFAASAVLIISLAVLVMCSVKGKKRED